MSNFFSEPRALGFLLPTMTLLLDPSTAAPSAVHQLAVTQSLSFASVAPTAFREASTAMETGRKDVLETSVRQAIEAKQPTTTAHAAKPQISLKAF